MDADLDLAKCFVGAGGLESGEDFVDFKKGVKGVAGSVIAIEIQLEGDVDSADGLFQCGFINDDRERLHVLQIGDKRRSGSVDIIRYRVPIGQGPFAVGSTKCED